MKISTLIFSFLLVIQAKAQVSFGENAAVRLTEHAKLVTEGIQLLPSVTTNLERNFFQKINTPVQMRGSMYSIAQVLHFSEPLAFTGTLRLNYSEADLNGNIENDLRFSFNTNGIWRSSSLGTVNTDENFVEGNFTNETFQSVTLSTYFATLPVALVSYTASLQSNAQVLLQWQTEFEMNNSHFTIERSPDGTHYTSLGTVKANATGFYTLTDQQPLSGNNYYRLRQHDLDGAAKLLGIRVVNTTALSRVAIITPNPVIADGFLLDLRKPVSRPLAYSISNTNGQAMKSGQLSGQQNWIAVSGLPAGTYILRLADGQTIRFQKQ